MAACIPQDQIALNFFVHAILSVSFPNIQTMSHFKQFINNLYIVIWFDVLSKRTYLVLLAFNSR